MERTLSLVQCTRRNHFTASQKSASTTTERKQPLLWSNTCVLAFDYMLKRSTCTSLSVLALENTRQVLLSDISLEIMGTSCCLFCPWQHDTSSWMFTFRPTMNRALNCDSSGCRISQCLCVWCVCVYAGEREAQKVCVSTPREPLCMVIRCLWVLTVSAVGTKIKTQDKLVFGGWIDTNHLPQWQVASRDHNIWMHLLYTASGMRQVHRDQ